MDKNILRTEVENAATKRAKKYAEQQYLNMKDHSLEKLILNSSPEDPIVKKNKGRKY